MDKDKLIPHNNEGKQVDLDEQKTFADKNAALEGFKQASQRLLHPQQWEELCGSGSASFDVLSENLSVKTEGIVEGDYIRINVPGPGPRSGDGYDWVRVALIESSDDAGGHLGVKLVPCANPKEDGGEPSHFFSEDSSSTLTVRLNDLTLSARYHGRNETVNNETGSVVDNIRNTVVATGALAGFSEWQWKRLIRGLVEG